MPVTDTSPNAANLTKGSGIGYFQRTGEAAYRDLGYIELINLTPAVQVTKKFAARGGGRHEIDSFVNQTEATYEVQLMEMTPSNLALLLGGVKSDGINLTTATGNTLSGSKTVVNLSLTTGMVKGRRYAVSGTGIPAANTGIFDGTNALLLDVAASATATAVALAIVAPQAFGLFDLSQVPGSFKFVGDNDVGLKVRMEALNVLATPNGALEILNSNSTDSMLARLTLDVRLDTYGNLVQVYLDQFPAAP